MDGHGSSLERKGKGKGERGRGAAARGAREEGGLLGEEAPWGCRRSSVRLVRSLLLLSVREFCM
jgi:hypothetical protein